MLGDSIGQLCKRGHVLTVCSRVQIVNMSSGLASKVNLAANMKGEGLYEHAAKMGLAYRSSKAALCMGALLFQSVHCEP